MSGTVRDVMSRAPSAPTGRQPADVRRALPLALAALWLLHGMLRLQPFMFTNRFATQIIAPGAQGNRGPSRPRSCGGVDRSPSLGSPMSLTMALLLLALR